MLLSLVLAFSAAVCPVPGAPADSAVLRHSAADCALQDPDTLARTRWASLHGLGLGVDMNSLANEVSAGLQAFVPLTSNFAIIVRPMLAGGDSSRDLDLGGRIDLQLHSPVYANLIRVYLGVGPQGFYELRGEQAHSRDFSGGWDVGAEVFLNQHFAVHWEMGTSGGDVTSGAGPAFSVGFRAYPGSGWR